MNAMDGKGGEADDLHRLFLFVGGALAVVVAARLVTPSIWRRKQ